MGARLPIHRAEMQQHALAGPVGRRIKRAPVRDALGTFHHAAERRFDGVGDKDLIGQFLADGRRLRFVGVLDELILPEAVEVHPFFADHLRAGVVGRRIVGFDIGGPFGHQRAGGGFPFGAEGKGDERQYNESSGESAHGNLQLNSLARRLRIICAVQSSRAQKSKSRTELRSVQFPRRTEAPLRSSAPRKRAVLCVLCGDSVCSLNGAELRSTNAERSGASFYLFLSQSKRQPDCSHSGRIQRGQAAPAKCAFVGFAPMYCTIRYKCSSSRTIRSKLSSCQIFPEVPFNRLISSAECTFIDCRIFSSEKSHWVGFTIKCT